MAENELQQAAEHAEHATDPTARKIGVLAAILAVLLAVVTIGSHRAHTSAIVPVHLAVISLNIFMASTLQTTVSGDTREPTFT